MNKFVKRGLSAYKILLKNKLAMALMRWFSGVMMFIAALNGRGNDTVSLPLIITLGGLVFSFWAFYRLGYIKSNYDKIKDDFKQENTIIKKAFVLQIGEALIYTAITLVGVFLLKNEDFTNKVLNLIAGGFTAMNGILNIIRVYKGRETKNARWFIMLILMLVELVVGPYFIIAFRTIGINDYLVMGILTTLAGIYETISVFSRETIKNTIQDGKDIVQIMKDNKNSEK